MNQMEQRIARLKSALKFLPVWVPSLLVLGAVLWLTLAPHPIGDVEVPLFEGEDKLVHAAMFLTLSFTILFDTMRARGWKAVSLPLISAVVFGVALLGLITEWLQSIMEMGRSLEVLDMAADFIGAVFGGVIWIIYQNLHLFVEKAKEDYEQRR